MTDESPPPSPSRHASTGARLAFAGTMAAAMGSIVMEQAARAPAAAPITTIWNDAQRAAVLRPLAMPPPRPRPARQAAVGYTHWKDDPANAIDIPSERGEWQSLDSLFDTKTVRRLAHPAHADSLGGRERPLLITWSPERFAADEIRINAIAGTVHVKDQLVLSWPVAKRWKQSEGVFLYGAPMQPAVAEDSSAILAPPSRARLLPLSTTAHYNHPFGERFMYRPENLGLLLAHAQAPAHGRSHDLSDLPVRTPAKQNPARITFADIDYKYDLCAKMLHDLSRWKPHGKDVSYRRENNIFPLMTFWKESREGCLPALDPMIVNAYGYIALPQFGGSDGGRNSELGVAKRNSLVALRSINVVDSERRWRPLTIDGKTLRGPVDLMRNVSAQMVCYYAFIGQIMENIGPDYQANKHRPHMKDITLFGAAMGGYLTGNSTAAEFMRTGNTKKDANGTTTAAYMRHFSQLPMEAFRLPETGLTKEAVEILTSAFEDSQEPVTPRMDIRAMTDRVLKPVIPDQLRPNHAERLKIDRAALAQASNDTVRRP